MSLDRFRLAGWLGSGVCLAFSASLIVTRHAALLAAAQDESRASADLQKARDSVSAVTREPADKHFACAPRAANEETSFLMDLRHRAHASGVSIVRWSSHATDYHRTEDVAATAATAALEGVTKVRCDVTLAGSYTALRSFLSDVRMSNRLLNVSHVDWSRTDQASELSLSLGRYLQPKAAAPAKS